MRRAARYSSCAATHSEHTVRASRVAQGRLNLLSRDPQVFGNVFGDPAVFFFFFSRGRNDAAAEEGGAIRRVAAALWVAASGGSFVPALWRRRPVSWPPPMGSAFPYSAAGHLAAEAVDPHRHARPSLVNPRPTFPAGRQLDQQCPAPSTLGPPHHGHVFPDGRVGLLDGVLARVRMVLMQELIGSAVGISGESPASREAPHATDSPDKRQADAGEATIAPPASHAMGTGSRCCTRQRAGDGVPSVRRG